MGIKLDPIEAINQLKEKYPQYDFSKAVFTKSSEKITVICPKHGEFYPTYNNMKSKNRGCPKCNGGVKFTEQDAIDKLKQFFPDYDYSKFKYNGHDKECTLICKNGHEVTKKYNVFAIGYGCNECKDTNLKTEEHKIRTEDYKSVEEYLHKLKTEYPDIDWTNAYKIERKKDKAEVKCKFHGYFDVVLENIKNLKHPCPFCANIQKEKENLNKFMNSDTRNITEEEYNKIRLNNTEYEICTDNTLGNSIFAKCDKHGLFQHPLNMLKKSGFKLLCPICYGGQRIEHYLVLKIRERYPELSVRHKVRDLIKSPSGTQMEIDIYIPEINFGIEYNEKLCHSGNNKGYITENFKTLDEYHQYKIEECGKIGILLVNISEQDVVDNGLENILIQIFKLIDAKNEK